MNLIICVFLKNSIDRAGFFGALLLTKQAIRLQRFDLLPWILL
jgi:hypothetical protein